MRLRELRVENFRKFRHPTALTGFSDGLNLVCESNETGKSTILEALRAALFERHGAKSDRIRSFRPHGDEVPPTVELVFDVDGVTWSLRKRFLQGASVSLESPVGRYQSDEAEEKLQGLLGFTRAGNRGADDDTRGALGLLWVEQGQSFVLGTPGQAARRTLEDVLASEVGAVTGGRRTSAVIQAVDKSLSDLLTATGKPTRRLLEAQEAWSAAQAAAGEAHNELQQFEQVLERLEAKRNEQRRLVRDLEDPELQHQAAQLKLDIDRAKAAAQVVQTVELVLRQATGDLQRLQDRSQARATDREALSRAVDEVRSAGRALEEHSADLTDARGQEAAAAEALIAARELLAKCELARDAALSKRLAAEKQRLIRAAFERLDRAEQLSIQIAALANRIASEPMNDEALADLDALERAVFQSKSVAEAGASNLEIALQPGSVQVLLNGEAITGSKSVVVTTAQEIAIAGVGRIKVQPPLSGEPAQATLRAAEQDLDAFLRRVGHGTVAEARACARARAQAEQELSTLRLRLEGECPADPALGIVAGLDALRGALSGEARPDPATVDVVQLEGEVAQAETAFQDARAFERAAEGRRQASLEALQQVQLREAQLAADVARTIGEHKRVSDNLAADLAQMTDVELVEVLDAARTAEARALVDYDAARRATEGLDLETLERRSEAQERRRQRLLDDRLDLAGAVARLEEQAKTLGGSGPATRAQAAAELADSARQVIERLREEAETLALLKRVIEESRLEASRRYLEPITRRVEPYVRSLLPNASLSFGDDYRPATLSRSGRNEVTEDLSKGTQEQLAVLTRLAFADLLIDKGRPASLVLDDALVFADDDRFEAMTRILSEAAQRMQIIVFSCRTTAYRHVDANRILIS